jgi:hypothetical protein
MKGNHIGYKWKIKNVETGEVHEVQNMAKWCRERKLYPGSLYKTITGLRNQHKGYKLMPVDR